MTPDDIAAALADLGADFVRHDDDAFLITLPGERRHRTLVWMVAGEHHVLIESFVCRKPDENTEQVYKFLLQRNAQLRSVAYAVDADGDIHLGRLAAYVRDRRIALEMCPTSNVHTGAVASIEQHPIELLRRLRFRVTVNTDNRLMSQTSMSKEMTALVDAFGYTLEDLRWFTINAMKSAFLPFDERLAIIDDVIKPGYAELGAL